MKTVLAAAAILATCAVSSAVAADAVERYRSARRVTVVREFETPRRLVPYCWEAPEFFLPARAMLRCGPRIYFKPDLRTLHYVKAMEPVRGPYPVIHPPW